MQRKTESLIQARPVTAAAILIAVVGTATIAGAWTFQYGFGYSPCPLCLEQRYAYYFAVPLAAMTALGDEAGASRKVLIAALLAIAAGMLWNTALGIYHSGIEWHWWRGPQTCSGTADTGSGRSLVEQIQSMSIVRCDEAPWRFLGLSLAGYNALISIMLALVAGWAAFKELQARADPAHQ